MTNNLTVICFPPLYSSTDSLTHSVVYSFAYSSEIRIILNHTSPPLSSPFPPSPVWQQHINSLSINRAYPQPWCWPVTRVSCWQILYERNPMKPDSPSYSDKQLCFGSCSMRQRTFSLLLLEYCFSKFKPFDTNNVFLNKILCLGSPKGKWWSDPDRIRNILSDSDPTFSCGKNITDHAFQSRLFWM